MTNKCNIYAFKIEATKFLKQKYLANKIKTTSTKHNHIAAGKLTSGVWIELLLYLSSRTIYISWKDNDRSIDFMLAFILN